jgi:hypothetical protein
MKLKMKATLNFTEPTKNTNKYSVTAGLANLGTLYFTKKGPQPKDGGVIDIPMEGE